MQLGGGVAVERGRYATFHVQLAASALLNLKPQNVCIRDEGCGGRAKWRVAANCAFTGHAAVRIRRSLIPSTPRINCIMKAKILGLTTALTFATILFAQRPSSAPDPAILAKLGEIVTVRERLAKNYESLVDAGRAPADSAADIDLAEARIAHALETGQRDAILAAH